MRKFRCMVLLVTLVSFIAIGCSQNTSVNLVDNKINVVTSFYPLYDFTAKIGGEHVHVINLVPAGVEPHDWSPKSQDLTNLTKADMFVYQGAGFEGWVDDFLDSLKKDSQVAVIEASHGTDLIKHEEGDHQESKAEKKDEHEHDELAYDPHVWLSLSQAQTLAANIKDGLIGIDSVHKSDYEANYQKLLEKFDLLNQKYKDALAKTAKKEMVVSHDAFGYLSRDYGLKQVPIMGLSPDAEPTPQDMKEISNFVKEHHVTTIFFEELVSDKLAKTLANDLKIQTLVLNPLEGLTEEQVKAGEDYFSIMEKNLQNLLKGLQ